MLQEQIRSYFPLGRGVCLYVYPVIDTFYGASIWLVASVAVERYINIVKRVKAYRNRSLKITTFTIVAIWLISFSVISLPLFFVIEFKEETSACFINWFKTPSFFLWRQVSGAPNDNFRKNICSEDDLRSRIFRTFVVKFLTCPPLLGFSDI